MTDSKKKVAVILSGCGFEDGAEIHESVLTMLALDLNGANYKCFAPDIPQARVYDHYRKQESKEKRNVLVEAARIARGDIAPMQEFDSNKFDALILPGGFGAASSLCTFANDGPNCSVNKDVRNAIEAMRKEKKPIGALCIAPVILAKVIPGGTVTIGNAKPVADAIAAMGSKHQDTSHGEIVIDEINKIVTTPCYMLESSISQIADGATKLVKAVLKMS